MKIPKLVYQDVTPEDFAAECRKRAPSKDPEFPLWSIVNVKGDWGRLTPGMVFGFQCHTEEGWTYHVLRPRHYDGALERVVVGQKDVSALPSE